MKYVFLILLIIVGFIILVSTEICLGIMPIESFSVPIAIGNTAEYTSAVAEIIGYDTSGLIFFVISIIVFSYLLGRYKSITRKKRAETTINWENIKSPFILYLRSFADEKSTKKIIRSLSDNRSEEEMLIDAFSDISPIYAIGDPADNKMPYGATRIYVDDSIWKEAVEKLAIKAEIVILRLGQTNNFWWEVNMALKKVPIDKIVFVIPWSKNFNNISTLYKTLLEHQIDISSLNISVDKKLYGSISSVLYFNNEKPESHEIIIPRFTGIFLSYDNMLRNALASFRERYGFKTKIKQPIIKARILFVVLILVAIVGCGGRLFGHLMELKYQRPYELVEECVKDRAFALKYGHEVNGTNLLNAILGGNRGQLLLSDEDFIKMFLIEIRTFNQLSYSEAEQINNEPFNYLLMIKKYSPEYYNDYITIVSKATLEWVRNPEYVKDKLHYYKQNVENLPQWVLSFINQYSDETDANFCKLWMDEVSKHVNDPDFSEVMKTIIAQKINPE